MSVERSFEAWEEVQRHGQDLADRLAQGFSGLIQTHMNPPAFARPHSPRSKLFEIEFPTQNFGNRGIGLVPDDYGMNGVSAIFDIGNRIGQAGVEFGACLNGMVEQLFRKFPVPFRHEESMIASVRLDGKEGVARNGFGTSAHEGLGSLTERSRDIGLAVSGAGSDALIDEEVAGLNLTSVGLLGRPQGTVNLTSNFDSRNQEIESSLVARGDLWRVEASTRSSSSGSRMSSLFLVQLGPILFVRDSTLLLPVHLSKQHLLWYGYDRKNGLHSLCPTVWSKHRRWLLMSMLCLNPFTCSFVDLQFPNGQFSYVSGDGVTGSAFVPVCGGLLQAQGQYPGEMRISFSCKNKWGTRITPMVKWPDRSFSLGVDQTLAWQRSGLLVRPTIQFSLCPTVGGSDPGIKAEVIHSLKEKFHLICGCDFMTYPSAFASISLGRSKWSGNVGGSGLVLRVDKPIMRVGGSSFSVKLNSGIEF